MNKLYLISCGPGGAEDITVKALNTVKKCGLLAGSERLIKVFGGAASSIILPASSEEAAKLINRRGEELIGVLLSGDAGFYSQAAGLRRYVTGREIITVPGVSVVQAAAAMLNIPWHDAEMISLHAEDTAGERKLPDGNAIILTKVGTELRRLFAGHPEITKEKYVWIIMALSTPQERVVRWDGGEFVCPELTTVVIYNKR